MKLLSVCIRCHLSRVFGRRSLSSSQVHNGIHFTSRLAADQLIRSLDANEIKRLTKALDDYHEERGLLNVNKKEEIPSNRVLLRIAFTNSIPFIGFGFLDNAIMIAAGEYIDIKVGAVFGLSTMAAAGIGNMISDVAGIGLAGYVEALASRLGFDPPLLTSTQLAMRQTKMAGHMGRAIGIVIGCILGMFPLMFVPPHSEIDKNIEEEHHKDDKESQTS